METIILNELRDRFNFAMGYSRLMDFTQENLDHMKIRLSDLPSETVYYLGEVINDVPMTSSEYTFDMILMYMLGASEASIQEIEDVACLFRHKAVSWSAHDHDLPRTSSYSIPSPLVRSVLAGLRTYELKGFDYDSGKSIRCHGSAFVAQCAALIQVALAMRTMPVRWRLGFESVYVKEMELAQLIVDYADDSLLLPSLIEERGADAEAIRSVLTSPTRILSEGAL